MKQHKWHKEIKAWADGAEIEYKDEEGWHIDKTPFWADKTVEFRIKPQPKQPQYLYVYEIDAKDIVLRDKPTGEMWLIGKIKLEVDDE